ncbi:Uu.00g055460.m01.CDS01 [Anthostomella pinea]|uniref:Uu.00g055460.m01.CDS01 n=1 Tax=Anthostomella pinea TaxID=933095 RepID=A0AAI8YPU4_9PEZI|nr:Uu.00g055460.m01.CDS01 [Anthostomella pinea]
MDQFPYLPKETQQLLLAGPALAPPGNLTSNFDNPPNKNGVAHAALAVCLTLATFSFFIRMYARVIGLRKIKFEDILTFVAYGAYIGYIYCAYRVMVEYGYFIHQWDIRLARLIDFSYILLVGGVLYSIALPFLKAAILLEWTRIFVPVGTRNIFWWLCITLVAIQLSFCVASVFALCFTCIPIQKIWDFTLPGTCLVKSRVEITSAAIHLASDLVILSLPQKVIWELQMSVRQKLGVSVIFSLGVLACVSAAFRLTATIQYSNAADVTYTVASVILWALAEMTCGFIVIGMPTAPKIIYETGVVSKIRASLKSWTSRQSGSGKSSTKLSGLSSQTSSKSPNPSKTYRKLDGNENATPLRSMKRSDTESTEHLKDLVRQHDRSIVRTTQLSTREDYEYGSEVEQDQFARQHPWRTKS